MKRNFLFTPRMDKLWYFIRAILILLFALSVLPGLAWAGYANLQSWTGAGYGSSPNCWYIGDFNGDGKDDMFSYMPDKSGAQVSSALALNYVPRVRPKDDPSDNDKDGISDKFEDRLAKKYAPEVRLPPDNIDWTRPANVDWYLLKCQLRFDHSGCSDCQVKPRGSLTQTNLWKFTHRRMKSLCRHDDSKRVSASSNIKEFFLQPADSVHKGIPSPGPWLTYVHVKKSSVAVAYIDIQYWFFYAYNDSVGPFNHEGDWEHITVSVNKDGTFHSAYFAQHDGGKVYQQNQLQMIYGTHPVVYSADGSHASYPTRGEFPIPNTPVKDKTYDGGPKWQTWTNLVNVGEKNAVLNGQEFIKYGGRWGEIGNTQWTSGPLSPSFQDSWNWR